MMSADNTKLEQVERLLRTQGPTETPGLRRAVLETVAGLRAPGLLVQPSRWRSRVAAGLAAGFMLTGLLALLLPANAAWLAAWQLELGELSLALTVGESVLSASLLSIAACVLAAVFTTFAGIYGVKHRLLSA